jgi:hypothetical protein
MTNSKHSQRPSGIQQVVILQPTYVAPDPAIPIMQETLLLLDLVVQEPSVDLREMSKLVLDDLGATLQILRLAGSEYSNSKDRPLRKSGSSWPPERYCRDVGAFQRGRAILKASCR